MKMDAPAIPLINIDPYFSIWANESVLSNTTHWTGKPNTMSGRVFVDGKEYHFLGFNPEKEEAKEIVTEFENMNVDNIEIDAYSTIITYSNSNIKLTVHFTSPTLITDLYYVSRPVVYCNVSYESIDNMKHDVSVTFTASEELVLDKKGEGRAFANEVDIPGLTAVKMGNGIQKVLNKSEDDIRINWGYLYMAVKGQGEIGHTMIDDMYGAYIKKNIENEALFMFAYDDIESIQYFGDNLKAYWKKDGKTIEQAILEAADEYSDLLKRCNDFSNKIKSDAIEKGSEKYAEILLLAVRQVMAGHKLVIDKNGNNLFISKECFSNGCAATVDVTYPSAPLFLLYNTELLKGMLRPIMDYSLSEEWCFDFAPHDVGQYPLVNGQFYGVERPENLKPVIDENMQMPVEECGNMIILFAAICEYDNNTDFVKPYINILKNWSKYLIKYGLDPENQLCTDDFAGHLAHNVNLSIKAIMGIAGYSKILRRLGENSEADEAMETARKYADALVKRAANADGSFRLAYDKPDTFSLKYNSVWDLIWKTNLFPAEFYKGEIARYKKEMLPYGVPLDSRQTYTKSDWLVWAASLADNKEDFNTIVDSLWLSYNTSKTYVPMSDWYYADTASAIMFQHRTVQGGLFIKLML